MLSACYSKIYDGFMIKITTSAWVNHYLNYDRFSCITKSTTQKKILYTLIANGHFNNIFTIVCRSFGWQSKGLKTMIHENNVLRVKRSFAILIEISDLSKSSYKYERAIILHFFIIYRNKLLTVSKAWCILICNPKLINENKHQINIIVAVQLDYYILGSK